VNMSICLEVCELEKTVRRMSVWRDKGKTSPARYVRENKTQVREQCRERCAMQT
jgi:hypothetical protein